MTATVDGAFRLIDKASGPMRKMEERALRLDVALKGAGDRLDTFDRKIDSTVGHVKALNQQLSELSRSRATPKINLEGVAKAAVQIEALKRAKDSLDRSLINNGARRGPIAQTSGRFGELGRVLGTVKAGVMGTVFAFGKMVPLLALALPAVVALSGAVGALAASLTSAVGGAGVLGGGAISLLAVGIGSVVAVAKSALSPLKEYRKAVDNLNKAQQAGDPRKIRETASAVDALAKKSPGLAKFSNELDKTKAAFKDMVGDKGRQSFFNFGAGGLGTLRTLMTDMRGEINKNAKAFFDSFQPIFKFLKGTEFETFLRAVSDTWQRSIGPFMKGALGYAKGFMQIIQAGLPWIERWSRSFKDAGQAFNTRASQKGLQWVDHMVGSFRQWSRLIHSTGGLLSALFQSGRGSGDSLVGSLSDTFDRWADWLRENPGKVRQFFADAVDSTRRLASGLSHVVSTLWDIGTALKPVLDAFSALAGNGGALQAAAGFAAGRGIFAASRRWGRGAGGAGADGGGGAVPLVLGGGGGGTGGLRANYNFLRDGGAGVSRRTAARMTAAEALSGLSVGGAAKGFAKGALRKAGPLALAFGAYDFLSTKGNVGDKTKGAINGFAFGIPKMLDPDLFKSSQEKHQEALARQAQSQNAGISQATDFSATHGRRSLAANIHDLRSQLHPQSYMVRSPKSMMDGTHAMVRVTPKLSESEMTRIKTRIAHEKVELHIRTRIHSQQRGTTVAGRIAQGYDQLREHGATKAEAFQSASSHALASIQHMQDIGHNAGAARLARLYDDWAAAMARKNPKLQDVVKKSRKGITDTLDSMGLHAKRVGGKVVEDLGGAWDDLQKKLARKNQQMLSDFSTTLTKTERKALGVLKAMGMTDAQARLTIQGKQSVAHGGASVTGSDASQATGAHTRRARGGTVPGVGLTDSVNFGGAKVAPGENVIVANRHTTGRIDRMLAPYGTTMMGEINGEGRPHSEPMQHLARGGTARGANFGGHPTNVTSGVSKLISVMERHFPGLSVSSTTDHSLMTTSGNVSDHSTGHAVDMSGSPAVMHQAAEWVKRSGLAKRLKQGIHNPNLSINAGQEVPTSFWGPAVWGQHVNHLHLALAGGLAGRFRGGGAFKAMRALGIADPTGAQGAAAQSGVNAYTTALNRRMRRAANQLGGATGGDLGDLSGFHGGGNAAANMRLGHRMMRAAGFGESQWPSLKALWTRESGWSNTARNPSSGAFGIPQALPPGKMGARAVGGDAAAQISWGLNYIKGRYGNPAAAWAHENSAGWYSHGGQMPTWGGWYGNGGSFTATRPTYIGVGEKGREKVTVTPARSSSGGKGAIHIDNLTIHGGKDTHDEVMRAFRDLTRELNLGDGD